MKAVSQRRANGEPCMRTTAAPSRRRSSRGGSGLRACGPGAGRASAAAMWGWRCRSHLGSGGFKPRRLAFQAKDVTFGRFTSFI